ncbi:hypothetical protein K432DRAFT_342902 [Lepidopterella palustris CBS 459.81]|uniref:RRM domain-containing protein n=1 Tax=Lepidopterella palustris CBS 459.81 TaxID=1314670 RepID=A0A8E2EK59_9PEZI|nr:hypothetical protein K432DRAFT_342902 [Lepidopterella palustris CBS 459.81]
MPSLNPTRNVAPTPQKVADYIILPLTLPSLPSLQTIAKHYLYIRPHAPKLPDPDSERSLFIANVPIDATEEGFRKLFAEQFDGGRVERVEFEASVPQYPTTRKRKEGSGGQNGVRGKKRKRDDAEVVAEGVIEDEETRLPRVWGREVRESGSSAVVVFVDRASARGVMKEIEKAVKKGREIKWKLDDENGLGVKRYRTHHSLTFPPKPILQASINAYLTAFNRAEIARNRVRARQRAVPDEDGFITVTRGGRNGPVRIEDAEAAKEKLEERKKKKGVMEDFYRFQVREKRKEREGELRRKFEEDRRKVSEMRERRGRIVPMS